MRSLISIVAVALVAAAGCDQGPEDDLETSTASQTQRVSQDGTRAGAPSRPGLIETPEVRGTPASETLKSDPKPAAAELPTSFDGPGRMDTIPTVPLYEYKPGGFNGFGYPDALKEISDKEVMERAMKDEDTGERIMAIISAARRKIPGSIELFVALDADGTKTEYLRETGVRAMAEHGGTEVVPHLWNVLKKNPLPRARATAITALGFYSKSEAAKAIAYGIKDPDPFVRGRSIENLWFLVEHPGFVFPYIEAGLEMPEQVAYQESYGMLEKMPYIRAGQMLKRIYLESTDPDHKIYAQGAFAFWRTKYPDLASKL
jgi:hypothetical protein